MTFSTGGLGVVGDLAEALGLVDEDGFREDWLADPGAHLKKVLGSERQRDALVRFIDEALGGAQQFTGPDGSVWLPVAEAHGPEVTLYVVLDDRAADSVVIGVGVRAASASPQSAVSAHVPLFRAAKDGHTVASPIVLGTPAARASLMLDITVDAAAPVPGQAHLGGVALALSVPTAAGGDPPVFSLNLRALQMPGAPSPRDLTLAASDADSLQGAVLELTLGLVRAQAAALPAGPLAALAGLLGLRSGSAVAPLPIAQLASDGPQALAAWFAGQLANPAARAAWLGELAALIGGAVAGERVALSLGPLRLSVGVAATPGAGGLARIEPSVAIELPAAAQVLLRAEAVLCSLDLGTGAAQALPKLSLALVLGRREGAGAPLLDVTAPSVLRIETLRAGLALDAERRPVLLVAADQVTIGSHTHATLDLSTLDAIADAGATVFNNVADQVLDRLGPAADAARVLLGLAAPPGHPGVPTLDIAQFLQDPLRAVAAHWRTLLQDHAAAVPAVITTLRDLVADADAVQAGGAVSGTGTAADPWRVAIAGPVALQAWRDGPRLQFGPVAVFVIDTLGQRCTRLETRLATTLLDIDLDQRRAAFLPGVELTLGLRARGHPQAEIVARGLRLTADSVNLAARWTSAGGLRVSMTAPNLALDAGSGPLAVPLPQIGADGEVMLSDAEWRKLEVLLGELAISAAPPWLDDIVGMLGWVRRTRSRGPLARLRLAELIADPAAELRRWLHAVVLSDHGLIERALSALATLLTGARDGRRGMLAGSGSPLDPWRVALGRAATAATGGAELRVWVGPDGPLPGIGFAPGDLHAWRPGQPGFSSAALEQALRIPGSDAEANADDVRDLVAGRPDITGGLEALVARWTGSDGRIVPPAAPPPGVNLVRLVDVTPIDLAGAFEIEDLLGRVPATVVHVAVVDAAATPALLPWPEVPADRLIDFTAAGLAPAAFNAPAAQTGEWYVALGGRDACRLAAGDEDGIQGQAQRLSRVLDAFAALPGGLVVVADAAAGHAARRAAQAQAAVTELLTLGTSVGPVSLTVLDTQPAADTLRLLERLLPPPSEDRSDDPDLRIGRCLVCALTGLMVRGDPAKELRPPVLPPPTPRAGLAVHMLYGEVSEAAVRRALTAIVVAGLAHRQVLRGARPVAAPDSVVLALRLTLPEPSSAAGEPVLSAHAQIELATLRLEAGGLRLDRRRHCAIHAGLGRAAGWLVGGPDPGRAPDAPQPHELRRVSFDVDVPLPQAAGDGAGPAPAPARAYLTLHEPRVFDLTRERWRIGSAAEAAAALPDPFTAVSTALPEVRVLLSSMAQSLAAATGAPAVAFAGLLRAIGVVDASNGSVPDAIDHLLNDPVAHLRALVLDAAQRSRLAIAVRALLPPVPTGLLDAALAGLPPAPPAALPDSVAFVAGPLVLRASFEPLRVDIGAASPPTDEAWLEWSAQLALGPAGVLAGRLNLGTDSAAVTGGVQLVVDQALRVALRWSRPGTQAAGGADELELWPNPQGAPLARTLARLVPAELTRIALEALRELDPSAQAVIDAALSAIGLLGAPAASDGARRVVLPAALFADPAAWFAHASALGGAGGYAPARLVALFDALKPLLGVSGPPGTWQFTPGVSVRTETDASGAASLALALDTAAFAPIGGAGAARLNLGGSFSLALPGGAAPQPGVAVFAGLPGAASGRGAVHLVVDAASGAPVTLFIRPAVGPEIPLYPNPAGLGAMAQAAVTQALPLVLDALAGQHAAAGLRGQVGTLVAELGDALALRSAGHFSAAALQTWAQDPAAALAARLPLLAVQALDHIADAIRPLLPAGATAAYDGTALRLQVGALTLAFAPSPWAVTVDGTLGTLPAIDRVSVGLGLDATGLTAFDLRVGPASVDAGGVILRPCFEVHAGAAPAGGRRAQLALGLPGNRLVGARWLLGNRLDLVLVDAAGSEHAEPEAVALGLLEAVLDIVGAFLMQTTAVTQLLAKPVGSSTVEAVLRGAVLRDAVGPPALIAQLFALDLLLGRLQRLAGNLAATNPSVTIDGALTIGLAAADAGGGARRVGVSLVLPRPAKLVDGDVSISLETDARWIRLPGGGAPPEGIVIDLMRVGTAPGDFTFVPGFSVNGVGLRVGRDERPLVEAGGASIGSVALHLFGQVDASSLAGGMQLQLASLAAGVAGASGGNAVAQGLLGDAGSGEGRLAPVFSPALSVQKHGNGPVLVGLTAGDGDGPWWLPIQRGFGPLYIEQVGFGTTLHDDQLERISVLMDGRVSLLGLTAAVDDLQLSFVVASDASIVDPSRWAVDLAGLAFSSDLGGITLQGGLRKFGSGDTVQYIGMLSARFAVYGLSVFGGYGQGVVNGERFASFFAFGAINAPIGGPPAFFVTGIGGGLGINRRLLIPTDLSQFDQYPFIHALDPGAQPNPDPMAALTDLARLFPMQRGNFWFAAGLSFTSFALVDGVVVVSIQVGDGLEVALLGLARMALPRPQVALVSIELGLVARFSSKEGVLWVQAQLTDNSWLLYPEVRLTGGFAFVSWFAGPLRGQFVLTIGGYHPRFHRAGYPEVPRLGLQWRVGSAITVKGESYFALTSEAVMAGVRVEVSARFGPAWAQVIFGADGIVFFDPFHFEVEAYASISAGVTIDVWIGEITISISIGARIFVEGPQFHGIATFSVGPVDLEVEFGERQQPPRPLLSWGAFVRKYLEEAGTDVARCVAVVPGKGALPPGTGPGGATDTAPADGSAAKPFTVYAEFEITLTNAIPLRRIVLGGTRTLDPPPSQALGLAPMGVANANTTLAIDLTRDDDHSNQTAGLRDELHRSPAFPVGVWGLPQSQDDPKLPKGDVIEATDGVRLYTQAVIPPGLPPIDYRRRVETGERHPLPFVNERRARAARLTAAGQLSALLPDGSSDDKVYAESAIWLARGGASRTALASMRGERAAPPRLGSLTDGLAAQTAAAPKVDIVKAKAPAPVDTRVARAEAIAVLSSGIEQPERVAIRTTVTRRRAAVTMAGVAPPTLESLAVAMDLAIPAVLQRVKGSSAAVQRKTVVASDITALTRMARAPLAAARGRGTPRDARERLEALNGALRQKAGAARAAASAAADAAQLAAGEVAVLQMPNAARDLDEKTPRPKLSVNGAPARIVALRAGGEVLSDVSPSSRSGEQLFVVPLGAERLAVVISDETAAAAPGLFGWHAGSTLAYLGWHTALAAASVVQIEGKSRSQRERGLRRAAGWASGAELVAGSALVSTRFAEPPSVVVVALDDPAGRFDGRNLSMAMQGATRAQGALGGDEPPLVVVRGQRSYLVYEVEATGKEAVTVSVASEDGWHLVGVMGARKGATSDAVAGMLAQRSLDGVVRSALVRGTAGATLGWVSAPAPRSPDVTKNARTPTRRRKPGGR